MNTAIPIQIPILDIEHPFTSSPSQQEQPKWKTFAHNTSFGTMPIRSTKTSATMLKLPKYIPPAPIEPTSTPATTHCIPLMIRMQQPASQYGKFDKPRILQALLHAFQNVLPDCNIRPTIHTPDPDQNATPTSPNKLLITATDILTDDNINKYLKEPPTATPEVFRARILLHSAIDIHVLKRNQDLISWLKCETITIDRNPLESSLKPRQIGFFTHFIVRTVQTSMNNA
jgi:hypothetical protein